MWLLDLTVARVDIVPNPTPQVFSIGNQEHMHSLLAIIIRLGEQVQSFELAIDADQW